MDIRAEVGDDILRIYKVGLDVKPDGETGDVALFFCNYSQSPMGYTSNSTYLDLRYESGAITDDFQFFGQSGGGSSGAYYARVKEIPIARTDETLTVIYDRYGESVRIEVPVPWEGGE